MMENDIGTIRERKGVLGTILLGRICLRGIVDRGYKMFWNPH